MSLYADSVEAISIFKHLHEELLARALTLKGRPCSVTPQSATENHDELEKIH